jgi:hypothetical protein
MRALLKNAMLVASVAASSNAAAFRTAGDLEQFSETDRVRWVNGEISYEISERLPADLSEVAIQVSAAQAFSSWSALDCTSLTFESDGFTEIEAGPSDGRNTIQFVESGWDELGYPAEASGATDVQYEKIDGEWRIVETDVYINAESFVWATTSTAPAGARTVFSVLFHEAGHILGLLHPCEEDGADSAPRCDREELSPTDSVMYPVYNPSQTSLQPDDIAGACYLYPACETEGCPAGTECSVQGCVQPCRFQDGGRCDAGEICTLHGCVSASECAATDCFNELPCFDDDDCDEAWYCDDDGTCRTGTRALGDPCENAQQCFEGTCVAGGYCAPICSAPRVDASAQCGIDGGTCDSPHHSQICADSLQPLGGLCVDSDECLGGQCLAVGDDAPVCTRLCTEADPCPVGWHCDPAADRAVCAPDTPESGCSVAPRSGHQHVPLAPIVFFAATLVGATIRLRRRAKASVRQSPQALSEPVNR